MSQLKKKMLEQTKVVKLKDTADKQVCKLNVEIQVCILFLTALDHMLKEIGVFWFHFCVCLTKLTKYFIISIVSVGKHMLKAMGLMSCLYHYY